MSKIVSLHSFTETEQKRIQDIAPNYTLTIGKAKELDPSLLREAEILVGWSKSKGHADEMLHPDSKLKWVQTWSAGVDYLPQDKFKERNISLTNTSGIHAIPISEMILGMMLSLSRNLKIAAINQSKSNWDAKDDTMSELSGKTIVIVGVGEIGTATAKLAEAFGMNVIGVRRSGKEAPHVRKMVSMDGLEEVLSEGDYVVNILPLTDDTRHLFNKKTFAAMKKGSCFLNVGRGATVDTSALLHALQEKQIASAALDVFEEEPLPSDHPLWAMDNVLITPHVAGSTPYYNERAFEIFIENLTAYVKNETLPRNLVDYSRSY
ncbi:D-2-hydroxyacid dehydrogenase [Paenibacillus sp. Marseille-Q4541]|uniref:D-2-hydroxyacid dehydrogenase n=1 Tax=Paenibacillus sp. Marseille-Q4541 TaxID=2831522 RepID=UPI001BAD3CCA|nr:D-2-hydroxyacid dehydrogenase [Paenibacillus sp. Marseille-Q4541]